MTYAAPLKVTAAADRVRCGPRETGAKSVKDIKEQDVYMGDVPFMTENGTFVVNGYRGGSSSPRCTVRRVVFFRTMTRQDFIPAASCFSPPASFPIAASWLPISNSTPRTLSMSVSTPPQAAGDHAALCLGPDPGGDSLLFLYPHLLQASERRQLDYARWIRPGCATPNLPPTGRTPRPARSFSRPGGKDHGPGPAQAAGRWRQEHRLRGR